MSVSIDNIASAITIIVFIAQVVAYVRKRYEQTKPYEKAMRIVLNGIMFLAPLVALFVLLKSREPITRVDVFLMAVSVGQLVWAFVFLLWMDTWKIFEKAIDSIRSIMDKGFDSFRKLMAKGKAPRKK